MLSFHDQSQWGRRSFLSVGALGLGQLTLPHLLAARARAAESGGVVKNKSVIYLFLHGGPTQIETFDPKMTAPTGVRSVTGEVATTLPGITFGGTFQQLAQRAHKFTVVRSFQAGDANHDIKPVVGKHTYGANLGSLYARVAGTSHPVTGMPRNVALFPRAVDAERQAANENFGKFAATGSLGSAYAPFIPGGKGDLVSDMSLSLPRNRLDDRRTLLTGLDRLCRNMDEGQLTGLDRYQEQAFSTIVGGVARAFDLSQEDARTIARYDTAPLVTPAAISRRWNNYNNYVDNAKTLGRLLLLARRLCEAGAGFVMVTTNFVWDMHADENNATIDEGMQYMGGPLDHALSAFIDDLEARGLTNDIMLVATGEMGRTPKLNAKGGRDHWGGSAPLFLHGGGIKPGQVIGQSTKDAGEPATEPYGIPHLVATVMHSLCDVGQLRLVGGLPDSVIRAATSANPIAGLF